MPTLYTDDLTIASPNGGHSRGALGARGLMAWLASRARSVDRRGDLGERADQRVGVGLVPGDNEAAGRHVGERNHGESWWPRVAQRSQRRQSDRAVPENGLHAFTDRAH